MLSVYKTITLCPCVDIQSHCCILAPYDVIFCNWQLFFVKCTHDILILLTEQIYAHSSFVLILNFMLSVLLIYLNKFELIWLLLFVLSWFKIIFGSTNFLITFFNLRYKFWLNRLEKIRF